MSIDIQNQAIDNVPNVLQSEIRPISEENDVRHCKGAQIALGDYLDDIKQEEWKNNRIFTGAQISRVSAVVDIIFDTALGKHSFTSEELLSAIYDQLGVNAPQPKSTPETPSEI